MVVSPDQGHISSPIIHPYALPIPRHHALVPYVYSMALKMTLYTTLPDPTPRFLRPGYLFREQGGKKKETNSLWPHHAEKLPPSPSPSRLKAHPFLPNKSNRNKMKCR